MNFARIKPFFRGKTLQNTSFSTKFIEEEYTATAQYPKILDLSFEARQERKKNAEYEAIKSVKTVEEKQIKLNMRRYYGFKCHQLDDEKIPYNGLDFLQHVTRTHLIQDKNLPEFYSGISVEDQDLQKEIQEGLLLELDGFKREHDLTETSLSPAQKDLLLSNSVSKQVNRVILNNLGPKHEHLKKLQVDFDPRVEAFWFAGGINPPDKIKKGRSRVEFLKPLQDEPVDRGFAFKGKFNLTLRSKLPLLPLMSLSECENPAFEVPCSRFDPRTFGAGPTKHQFQANISGVWAKDPCQFGVLSYQNQAYLINRAQKLSLDDTQEALNYHGILSSFSWLHAISNNLGFNTFNDLTYPLTTQTVITNGQFWSFFAYQLNTTLIYGKNFKNNPKRNICWSIPQQKLFEKIEEGQIIGFNPDTLKSLLKFYCNSPKERLGVNLTPYLSSKERLIEDYEDQEKRNWLEKEYKFIVSNRPRFKQIDEIYLWEKIYKIDNKTRFMEKKLRFFELRQKPQNRRYDERQARYIPRKLRPDLPRWKGRYAPEFFP